MDENTKLLLRFDGDFTDKSGNIASANIVNTNITVNSDSMKFGSGSGSFNGTNSFISIQSQYLPAVSGDWTVDWWEYRTSVVVNSCILNATADGASNNDRGILIGYAANSSNLHFYATDNAAGWNIASGLSMGTVQLNQWVHRAVVKSGNNYYTFQNGVLQAQTSSTRVPLTPGVTNIGSYAGGLKFYNGLIDEFRVSDIARWTSNFTVPTEDDYKNNIPLYIKHQGFWIPAKKVYRKNNNSWVEVDSNDVPNYITSSSTLKPKYVWKKSIQETDENTRVLISFNNNIKNEASSPLVNENVTISSSIYKFKNGSGYFNRSGKIKFNISDLNINLNNNWAIEWWEYPTKAIKTTAATFCVANGKYGFVLGASLSNNNTRIFAGNSEWDFIPVTSIAPVVLNSWTHYSVNKAGSNIYVFQNGVLKSTISTKGTLNMGSTLTIGYRDTSSNAGGYVGYLDDIRISNIARHTSNFSVPVAPYSYVSFNTVGYVTSDNPNKYPSNGLAADGYYYERV